MFGQSLKVIVKI